MSVTEGSRTPGTRLRTRSGVWAAFLATAVVAGVLAAGLAMPAVGMVGSVANSAVATIESLPTDMDAPTLPQRTEILDSDGNHLAWYFVQNRKVVPLEKMGKWLPQAIVAIEDSRFYEHEGVDFRGTLRALATNQGAGEVQQGGSTITQQYVKLILLTQARTKEEQEAATERTIGRKLREASLALAMEKDLEKEEILEGYLNIAYYGAGAYGAEAAAERYFGKPAAKLSLAQSATLAGIVQQPGGYDPLRSPKSSRIRRDEVLRKMYEQGMITQQQFNKATEKTVKQTLDPSVMLNGCPGTQAPYFCDYVLQTLRTDPAFGKTKRQRIARLTQGGFEVTTSIQMDVQEAATEAVFNHIPKNDGSKKAVAISMVEPGTGEIIAMSQNRDWGTSGEGNTTYNYNVEAKLGGTQGMQSGSTFKIFTLAAALEKGISPYTSIASPQTRTFYNFKDCDGYYFPPYTVSNSTGSGTFNMFSGTALSVNTFFIGLEQQVDMCRQAEIAESMGVFKGNGDKLERVPSFPLGANEITPLGLANAYATFANHGTYCEPRPITLIKTFKGKKLYDSEPSCREVISPAVADTVSQILVGVINGGTGAPMNFGRPAAGKTGTTDSNAAVWFAGYTPQVAAAVWVGDPRGGYAYPIRDIVINGNYYSRGYGSTLAGPVWKNAMIAAHEDLPYQSFQYSYVPPPPPPPVITEPEDEDTDTGGDADADGGDFGEETFGDLDFGDQQDGDNG